MTYAKKIAFLSDFFYFGVGIGVGMGYLHETNTATRVSRVKSATMRRPRRDHTATIVDGYGTADSNAYFSLKSSLLTPHTGHSKSAGTSSHGVPAGIPASGTPTAGSYTQPQMSHLYFIVNHF